MPTIPVGQLTFEFSDGWEAEQLDEWAYYRKQFLNLGNNVRMACSSCSAELRCESCKTAKFAGMKGCDIVAVGPTTVWLIEVKDYRRNPREKAIGLADEVALKVRDSLAVLLGASANANEAGEKDFAGRAVRRSHFRVVLHLEQPLKPTTLFPRAIKPADVLQRLKQLMKAVDPHPLVVETSDMHHVPWTVN